MCSQAADLLLQSLLNVVLEANLTRLALEYLGSIVVDFQEWPADHICLGLSWFNGMLWVKSSAQSVWSCTFWTRANKQLHARPHLKRQNSKTENSWFRSKPPFHCHGGWVYLEKLGLGEPGQCVGRVGTKKVRLFSGRGAVVQDKEVQTLIEHPAQIKQFMFAKVRRNMWVGYFSDVTNTLFRVTARSGQAKADIEKCGQVFGWRRWSVLGDQVLVLSYDRCLWKDEVHIVDPSKKEQEYSIPLEILTIVGHGSHCLCDDEYLYLASAHRLYKVKLFLRG